LLDYIEIDEVLTNLLENATKYTPAGTQIAVSARPAGGDVLVEVADRGPGIPVEALTRIFDPFVRVGGSRARGTGLGLAVARGLVEAHGGKIWAENRPEGGAKFAFTLPMVPTDNRMPIVTTRRS
jgi:two-component system sensor histidine kinase KdpD